MTLDPIDIELKAICSATRSILETYEPKDKEAIENTPGRVWRMWDEVLCGYNKNVQNELKNFDFVKSNDLVIVKDIPFYSMCKHHLLPFFGKAHVGYLPNKKILGLSKIARIAKIYSQRFQLQERIGRQICDAMMKSNLSPKGVIVVLDAQHMCMQMRGIESIGSITTTASLAGEFENNSELKREFYHLIGRS